MPNQARQLIENSDRGITLNKSLAWTICVGLIGAGITGPILDFRDGANVHHKLTPAQFVEMARKGKEAASAIYAAAWTLKDNAPIPADLADDKHWP